MCDVAASQKADGSPGISICFFHLVNSDAYIRFPNTSSAHAIHCNYRELCKNTNRALAVAMVTGLSSGGLQCGAIFHFNKNYVCFKGQVWAHNHIDIQFIWLHWMLLKDERLEWILSTDKVSFIFSCEVYGSVYYMISDVIIFQKTKEKWNRRLSGIMLCRIIIYLKAVTLLHSFPIEEECCKPEEIVGDDFLSSPPGIQFTHPD